jgi:DNA polymerase I
VAEDAVAVRNSQLEGHVERRLARRGLDDVKLYLVQTFDDAWDLMQWFENDIGADGPLAVDTETTGFKWHGRDYARTVQIGDDTKGWMIPIDRWWGLFLDIIKNKHRGPLDLMNAKFDYPFLRKAGVELDQSRIRDVGVMAHILEPHMSRAPKNQAVRHVDPRADALAYKLHDAIGANGAWTWETVPVEFEPYWSYGALDAVLTRRLSQRHLPMIEAQAPKAFELENAFQWLALKTETYGAHVDVEYARQHYDKFTKFCDEVETWCQSEYGIKPGSNQAVIRKLVELGYDEGAYFAKRTKSGATALDRDVLEDIDHPLAQAVLQRRQLQKIASTYLRFYVENADVDSLIHPSINTLGARTGRMSMSEPNLQNLPVRGGNPAVKVVRNCITSRPGHTLIMCDLDQIEMRGLAIDSGDQGLIDAFSLEEDFFVTISREIFNDPTLVKSDPRRQPTKNGMYARIYGAGLAKQAATAGVTIDQMRFVSKGLDARYPGIERYANQVIQEAMANGRAENSLAFTTCPLTGRRHYADRGKEYALVNYRIQGWAAALFKMKALELDAAGLGDFIIAFVHDEFLFDVPDEDVRDAIYTIQKIMNDDTLFPVKISSGISTGKRWGEKKEWVDVD